MPPYSATHATTPPPRRTPSHLSPSSFLLSNHASWRSAWKCRTMQEGRRGQMRMDGKDEDDELVGLLSARPIFQERPTRLLHPMIPNIKVREACAPYRLFQSASYTHSATPGRS
ncbi:hypothetical protein AB1N83_012106 [Pleurotus pulmonarius]